MVDDIADQAGDTDILVISDGKAGHLNQSLGLAEALIRQRQDLRFSTLPALRLPAALSQALRPRRVVLPPLLIGAGHGTHATLAALRRRRRSRAIVLMRPSLPLAFFDVCIEPRHDGGTEAARRWLSHGALNRMRPSGSPEDRGLILLGGPSPHYQWDSDRLLGQLVRICDGSQRWTLSDSRRTPDDILQRLRELQLPGLEIRPLDSQPPGWLANELPCVQRCWISPDSASMVYEALTAGCAVAVFSLEAEADSRVARGLEQLTSAATVTTFEEFERGACLAASAEPLAEADRCARRILELGWL